VLHNVTWGGVLKNWHFFNYIIRGRPLNAVPQSSFTAFRASLFAAVPSSFLVYIMSTRFRHQMVSMATAEIESSELHRRWSAT